MARNFQAPSDFLIANNIPITELYCIPTWAGSHALTSTRHIPLKHVQFLPILPYSITRHETVYIVLKNLKIIADVLEQDTLPFVVDEDLYQYIVDIYLHSADMFTNIFPILGSFQTQIQIVWDRA